jgi:hypothetical protein
MKDKQTIAQFLKVNTFPFVIKDKNDNEIYSEYSNGFWNKCEYDDEGNGIYYENSNGYWLKSEYNDEGNVIYYENSDGFWIKREYDDKVNVIYYENSDGYIIDYRPKPIIELTLEDIAKLKGVDVSQIRIKE